MSGNQGNVVAAVFRNRLNGVFAGLLVAFLVALYWYHGIRKQRDQ